MLVLAIDTATKIGSVALYDEKIGVVGEINLYVKVNHSNIIMEAIDNLFKMTGYNITDVERVAVTIGPGSFTGIRIGVAVAKGLCYGNEKTIVGINELDMLAENSQYREGLIIPLIDARKERVYHSAYRYDKDRLERLTPYKDGELRELLESLRKNEIDKKITFIGDGAIAYENMIKEILGERAIIFSKVASIPRAVVAGKMSLEKTRDNLYTLEPFYVNKSQAEREREEKIKKSVEVR